MNVSDNVIEINWQESQKCPTGSLALAEGAGICDVIAANGWERKISWTPNPDDPDSATYKWVHVRELRRLDTPDFWDCVNLHVLNMP